MQWLMLQQDTPTDFVISTGKQYSVRQFVQWSAAALGIGLDFVGQGINEVAVISSLKDTFNGNLEVGQVLVKVSDKYFRLAEVETLLGDASLANEIMGWKSLISVEDMCKEMVNTDLRLALSEVATKKQLHMNEAFSIED